MSAAREIPLFLPSDYASVIRTLPKRRAASLAWALKQCEAAVATLVGAEDPHAVLEDASVRFFRSSHVLLTELLPLMKSTAEPTEPLSSAFGRAQRVIGEQLGDPAAAAALGWTLTHAIPPTAAVLAAMSPGGAEDEARVLDDGLESFLASAPGGMLRAQLLAVASIAAAEREPPLPRAMELAWLAFEEATGAIDAMGTQASLFSAGVPQDRSREVLDAAGWAREVLTPSDLRTIDKARVRTLR